MKKRSYFYKLLLFTASFFMVTSCTTSENISSSDISINETPSVDNRFTVTFDGNGGTLISGNEIQKVNDASEIKEPVYEKAEYLFDGWDKKISSITESTTVTAKWKENKNGTGLSIDNFDKDGDTLRGNVNNNIESFSFINKVHVDKSSTWKLYQNIEGTTEIATKTISLVQGDNTVYILVDNGKGDLGFYTVVVRRLKMVTVRFDSRTGVANKNVQEGDLIEPPAVSSINGYTFVEWLYEFSEPISSNITIYANLNPHKYNITYLDQYNLDFSGTFTTSEPTIHTYGTNTTLVSPVKEGYTFDGWYTNSNCSGTRKSSLGATEYLDDIILYAKWSINKHTLAWNFNSGTALNQYTSGNIEYGTQIIEPVLEREHYSFAGWDKDVPNTMPDSNITLSAIWLGDSYSITYYDQNNESFSGVHEDIYATQYTYGNVLPLDIPTKNGYIFGGWHKQSNCLDEPIYTLNTNNCSQNIVLYAKWSQLSVESNNSERGDVEITTVRPCIGNVLTIRATPKNGYIFGGWLYQSNIISTSEVYSFNAPTGDVELLAYFFDSEEALGTKPFVDEANKLLSYGLYPQSVVRDNDLIDNLNSIDPSLYNENGWCLFNNRYYYKTDYWYACEPVFWKILDNSGVRYWVISSSVLDNHIYDTHTQQGTLNYNSSMVKTWLTTDFFNKLFSLDSSYLYNQYTWVPTVNEINNEAYGFIDNTSRISKYTDYACSRSNDSSANYEDIPNARYMTTACARKGNTGIAVGYMATTIVLENGSLKDNAEVSCEYGIRPLITIDIN